jgi:hypothetical protein
MFCNRLFFASLIVASFLLSTTPLSSRPKKRCVTVTRAEIQEKFGKPVKCLNNSKDGECFGNEREPIRVQFNSSEVVTSIDLFTGCNGLYRLMNVLNESVPKNVRGKYRRRLEPRPGSCQSVSEEEYECLRIRYFQENCMGCSPASIKVIWK